MKIKKILNFFVGIVLFYIFLCCKWIKNKLFIFFEWKILVCCLI